MVAPSPRARRQPPRPQPRPLPPSAGRPPPPYQYGPPRRHGGRRLLVLVLVLATIGAVGYLYLSRSSKSTSTSTAMGFVEADQRVVQAVAGLTSGAQKVQRFAALHSFDLVALTEIEAMNQDLTAMQNAETGASAHQKQIAEQAISDTRQAIDAATRYRKAVAFTYRLSDAETARQDMYTAVASLQQQAKAWQHG